MQDKKPQISKTKYIKGLICLKRLYLDTYKSHLASPVSVTEQGRVDESIYVGKLARKKFPDGLLIKPVDFEKALRKTFLILNNNSSIVLFEAAFRYADVVIRSDILIKKKNNLYDLIEVKSSSKVKKRHPFDAGIQYYVLQNNGIKIDQVYLMHINPHYQKTTRKIDLDLLFTCENITRTVCDLQPEIISKLRDVKKVLNFKRVPSIYPGKHCKKPFLCQYFNYCLKDLDNPVTELPRVSDYALYLLNDLGIKDISQIPSDFPVLTGLQQRVRNVVVEGIPFINSDIKKEFQSLKFPLYFLDFEAFNPAIPLYKGTKPYQMIPFQWSLHILSKNGRVKHKAYLHNNYSDPHRSFASSLLKALKKKGSILVYSNFESTRIKELAQILPVYSKDLKAIQRRIIDLQQIIKSHCYLAEFHGSYSLKNVLPVLVPDLDYSDLEISNGASAAKAFTDMMQKKTPLNVKQKLFSQLLDYCKRDTEAMLLIYKYFMNTL
jgi:CRISPR/Cas system-associated exonuclease Cas4 (RecB family)